MAKKYISAKATGQVAIDFTLGNYYSESSIAVLPKDNNDNSNIYKCTAIGERRALLEGIPNSGKCLHPLLIHAFDFYNIVLEEKDVRTIHMNIFEKYECVYGSLEAAEKDFLQKGFVEYRCIEVVVGEEKTKDTGNDI